MNLMNLWELLADFFVLAYNHNFKNDRNELYGRRPLNEWRISTVFEIIIVFHKPLANYGWRFSVHNEKK